MLVNFAAMIIGNIRKSWSSANKSWLLVSLFFIVLIAIPLLSLLYALFFSDEKSKSILEQTLPAEAFSNTLLLCLISGMLSLIIGVSTSWLVSQYRFPFRNFFNWAMALPLTIPGYILAFTYAGLFSFSGPLQTFLRNQFGESVAQALYIDIMTFPMLCIILSLSLFPYVFLSAKTAFALQSASQLEAARSLGKRSGSIFFTIALPMARPALAAGVFLVIMEVLNDYGASSYFGIRTYTTSLFKTWSYDLNAAVLLAGWILIFVFALLLTEKGLRGSARYHNATRSKPSSPRQLKGWKSFLAFSVCALPFLLGFLIPFSFLLYWGIKTAPKILNTQFFVLTWNSIQLALLATLLLLFVAMIIAYTRHLHKNRLGSSISGFISVGYAIPGAIIAVGVMLPAGYIDAFVAEKIWGSKGLLLSGSIGLLLFAYLVRFLAVAYQPLEAALEKNNRLFTESSRSLGKNALQTLFRVDMPLMRNTLLVAGIMVFVDVMKELPLTLILRPFNFDTLATETYRHAKVMESVPEGSCAALIIIFIGIIPVFFLNKLMKDQHAA